MIILFGVLLLVGYAMMLRMFGMSKWTCSTIGGGVQCVEAKSGYDTIQECQANCHPPTRTMVVPAYNPYYHFYRPHFRRPRYWSYSGFGRPIIHRSGGKRHRRGRKGGRGGRGGKKGE